MMTNLVKECNKVHNKVHNK